MILRSRKTTWAALRPAAPMTPPPGTESPMNASSTQKPRTQGAGRAGLAEEPAGKQTGDACRVALPAGHHRRTVTDSGLPARLPASELWGERRAHSPGASSQSKSLCAGWQASQHMKLKCQTKDLRGMMWKHRPFWEAKAHTAQRKGQHKTQPQ